jgi:hypothetical protein
MDDLIESLRRQVDRAVAPVEPVEVLHRVTQRAEARRRRTAVVRVLAMSAVVVLVVVGAAAVLRERSPRADVSTGPQASLSSCGAYKVTLREISDGTNSYHVEQQCILDAFAVGDPALLRVERPTSEGTPVTTYYLVTGVREAAVVTDSTGDPYSSGGLGTQLCTSLELAGQGPLLTASGCDGPAQCGSFDLGTDWTRALRDPVKAGVHCLTDAFDARSRATLAFSYTSDSTTLHWSYLVEGTDRVLVAARRAGPDVAAQLRFTFELCATLTIDSSGAPVAAACTPLRADADPGSVRSSLRLPPVGDALPDQLVDGTPVWVVHHDDGSVTVVDAVSSHRPFGFGQLVGWCPSSRGFEDPEHGSQFDERGRNRGGPAPTGLATYATGAVENGTVTVTGQVTSSTERTQGDPAAGPGCFNGKPELELHDLAAEPGMTLRQAMDQAAGRWVVIADAPIVVVTGQPTTVCDGALYQSAPPKCEGVTAPGHSLVDGQQWAVFRGTFAARIIDGTVQDIVFVSGRNIEDGPSDTSSTVP